MICNLCVFLFSLSTDDDCTDSCESLNNRSYNNNNTAALSSGKSQSLTSSPAKMISDRINEDGLILPKKLHNPCADSSDRQSLHRELLFNQKMWVRSIHHHNVWQFLTKLSFPIFSGKNVLNQKTELQRALEKQKERQLAAAQNEIKKDCTTSTLHGELGKVIMERAQKKAKSDQSNIDSDDKDDYINEEYIKARANLHRISTKYTWFASESESMHAQTASVSQWIWTFARPSPPLHEYPNIYWLKLFLSVEVQILELKKKICDAFSNTMFLAYDT